MGEESFHLLSLVHVLRDQEVPCAVYRVRTVCASDPILAELDRTLLRAVPYKHDGCWTAGRDRDLPLLGGLEQDLLLAELDGRLDGRKTGLVGFADLDLDRTFRRILAVQIAAVHACGLRHHVHGRVIRPCAEHRGNRRSQYRQFLVDFLFHGYVPFRRPSFLSSAQSIPQMRQPWQINDDFSLLFPGAANPPCAQR